MLKTVVLRNFLLLLGFGLFLLPAYSQNAYQHQLELLPKDKLLNGQSKIVFHNNSAQPLDSIPIHLPPRSLAWKGSYLNQQLIDYQSIKLYYSDSIESGYISINSLKAGGHVYNTTCQDCEFVYLRLNLPLKVNGSIEIEMDYQIGIAGFEYNGIGYDGSIYRLIDWLPRVPVLDSIGWGIYPVTLQNDIYYPKDSFDINVTLPSEYIIASNATLNDSNEITVLEKLSSTPFSKTMGGSGLKTLHYSHIGTSLQFLISKDFYVNKTHTGYLFFIKEDPFTPNAAKEIQLKVKSFFDAQIGNEERPLYNMVILSKKIGEYQSDCLLTINYPKDYFELAESMVHARAQSLFRYQHSINGRQYPWMARGIPYFYKYLFIEEYYPKKNWIPLENDLPELGADVLRTLFQLDAYPYYTQNQFLYLFLARQGLDQPMSTPVDSLTLLNYEGITQAKTYLALSHLKNYIGDYNFKRGMKYYYSQGLNKVSNPDLLKKSLGYYSNKEQDWFFNTWLYSNAKYDYRLVNTDYCPTVSTATIKNAGGLVIPYSLTGYKDGKPILTEWHSGHDGTKSVQMYHDNYDKVVINSHETAAEYDQQNNERSTKGLFKSLEPIKPLFFIGFEKQNRKEVYFFPGLNFNAYDRLLISMDFYNAPFINRRFEYSIQPEYSTGTGSLTGASSFIYNIVPKPNSTFRRIKLGLYSRYYHYDENLAFFRLSPSVTFYIRKPYPKSPVIQSVRFRGVRVDREIRPTTDFSNSVNNASYTIFDAVHKYEHTRLLAPLVVETNFQLADKFSKATISVDKRWMLPNKRWIIWRSFGGVFLSNSLPNTGNTPNFYSFGLSGTQDYLFDYYFIGRSDTTGIWSQQMFTTDGGFKSQTNVFANDWMLTTNVTIPIWSVLGVFGDLGYADNFNTLYWDYGIRIALLTDFVELYLPIQSNQKDFITATNYPENLRFVLDLDLGNILNRVRRGYY